MSAKLRQCRQGLAAALVRATNEVTEVESCSPVSSNISGPVLNVSYSFSNHHPENLHYCSVSLDAHNHISRHLTESPGFRCIREGSGHMKEDFPLPWTDAELLHDLPAMFETSSLQTLEELVTKLEFENEPNPEGSRLTSADTPSPAPPARTDTTGGASSVIEEEVAARHVHTEDDEHASLLDTVLEMEQEYNLSVYK